VIVSHEHQFIFLKTHKTASTSLEVFFSDVLGDDAIVTGLIPAEEGYRARNCRGLFNPLPELSMKYVGREPSLRDRPLRKTAANLRRGLRYYNHMPASLARARLGRKTWDRYYKFCFERNPWDKAVSMYFYQHRKDSTPPPFEQYLRTGPLPTDWHTYTLDDRVAVDFIGRYETLEDDFATVLRRVGIDRAPELPRSKGQHRTKRDEPVFTEQDDAVIRGAFAREIELFGYTKPERHTR
jgi:hypothetical protein